MRFSLLLVMVALVLVSCRCGCWCLIFCFVSAIVLLVYSFPRNSVICVVLLYLSVYHLPRGPYDAQKVSQNILTASTSPNVLLPAAAIDREDELFAEPPRLKRVDEETAKNRDR